ncbi:BTB and MATH domain-containing protein 36-like [Tubulanus polymorphus]|uniref:BTB and MATH domain-containing protein 36-like n=1 Tax=Tubulanus polymorphus TaxID=672921 RepID=UPI003DA30BC0
MMANKYPDYTKPWRHSDISFHVEGKIVHANKTILSMWSPVFEAMFTNDFKEKHASEIKLPGKDYNDILELLRVIHPPNKKIDGNSVYKLLPLAREYQMFVLTENCEEYLLTLPPSMEHLIIAEEYNLPKLLDKCISFASNVKLCDLESRTEFKQLEQTTMIELLRRKIQTLETKQKALKTIHEIVSGDRPHWRYDCLDESRGAHKQRSDISCDACSYWMCDEVRKKCRQIMENLN